MTGKSKTIILHEGLEVSQNPEICEKIYSNPENPNFREILVTLFSDLGFLRYRKIPSGIKIDH